MFRKSLRVFVLGIPLVVIGLSAVPAGLGNDLSGNNVGPSPATQHSERMVLPTQHNTAFKAAEYGRDLRVFTTGSETKRPLRFSVGRLEWTLRSAPRPAAWKPRVSGVLCPENPPSVSFDLRWKER